MRNTSSIELTQLKTLRSNERIFNLTKIAGPSSPSASNRIAKINIKQNRSFEDRSPVDIDISSFSPNLQKKRRMINTILVDEKRFNKTNELDKNNNLYFDRIIIKKNVKSKQSWLTSRSSSNKSHSNLNKSDIVETLPSKRMQRDKIKKKLRKCIKNLGPIKIKKTIETYSSLPNSLKNCSTAQNTRYMNIRSSS